MKVKYAEIRNSFANDIQKGERKIKARKGDLGMGGREVTEQILRRRMFLILTLYILNFCF